MSNRVSSFEGLKSLPVSVAILDPSGTIVAVNDTWKQFGRRNGLRMPHSAVGSNYLQYCRSNDVSSSRFASQLKSLLAGRRDLLTFIYPCHSPRRARWFCLVGLPLSLSKSRGVALLHTNLTAMLPLPVGVRRRPGKEKARQVRPKGDLATVGGVLERSVLEALSSELKVMLAGTGAPARSAQRQPGQSSATLTPLSKRQMQVLHLLGEGKSNKEIAMALLLSPNTIKLHVSAILQRLKLRTRTEAALLSSRLLQGGEAQ